MSGAGPKTRRLLFSADMVRAWLAGRKTVTRRTNLSLAGIQAGDPLLGKETWAVGADKDGVPIACLDDSMAIHYPADGPKPGWCGRTRVSIHMPDKFIRLRAVVVSARVEALGELTEAEAAMEGFPLPEGMSARINGKPGRVHDFTALNGFRRYWSVLHGAWTPDLRVVRIQFRPEQP